MAKSVELHRVMRPPSKAKAKRPRPPKPPDGHSSADVPMFLTLYRDEATLYRDMSGKSLHRRGYRDAALHRAALNESAAAGALAIAGWAEACERARREPSYRLPVLVDPMCGSGTILIEAALMAGAVAPGLVRADASHAARRNAFAFENWPDHDRDALDSVLREAGELGREARKALGKKPVLVGCEIHPGALSLARRAARLAGVEPHERRDRGMNYGLYYSKITVDIAEDGSSFGRQPLKFHTQIHNLKSAIRFSVKGGGCNGFNYQLKPTDRPAETLDEVVKITFLYFIKSYTFVPS